MIKKRLNESCCKSESRNILESYIRKAVVQELSNRRRKLFEYDDDDEFEDAEVDEPSPEDYIIADSRSGGYDVSVVDGKHLKEFEDYDDAVEFIRKHADRSKFWPNAWYQTERGRIEGPIEY